VPGIYVIRVDLDDGTSVFPALIVREGPSWEIELDEAEAHYGALYAGRGILSIEYARNLRSMPVPNAATLRSWREIKRELERTREGS
jgi:hypothetical protein